MRAMSVAQNEILMALARLHTQVSSELASSNQQQSSPTTRNAKRDVQRPFDLVADSVVLRCLEREFGSGIVLSEESNDSRFGTGMPTYRFVVDRVDGRGSWLRRSPLKKPAAAWWEPTGDRRVNSLAFPQP